VRASSSKKGLTDYLKFVGPGTIITLLGFIMAYQFVAPAPPRHITIATGIPEGACYKFGSACTEALKKFGITVEVFPIAGSAENLDENINRINRSEAQVSQTSVPLSFSNELYHLRLHIEMLREKLIKSRQHLGNNTSSA